MLAEAIASVAAQSISIPYEVIVCDDCRLPQTQAVVARFPNDQFRYLPNPSTLGAVGNWNRCLKQARGLWVMVLHEDDALYPWFFESVLPLLNNGSAAVSMLAARGLAQPAIERPNPRAEIRSYRPRCFLKSSMTPFPGVLIRRDVALKLGGFDEKWGPIADYEFWYRLSCAGRIQVIRAIGAFYRVAPGQWTQQVWGRMLRLAHLLRLKIAREQFPRSPVVGQWIARFFSYRNACFYAERVGPMPELLRRCLRLGRIPLARLPNGWVWQALKIASRSSRRHSEIIHDVRAAQIQPGGGGLDRVAAPDPLGGPARQQKARFA